MNITFYKNEEGEELEVKSWREADHGVIDCGSPEDLIVAGMWLQSHRRSISDWDVFAQYSDAPYIEFNKVVKK